MKILIAGGTGLIGSELANKLVLDGHIVHILSREKHSPKFNMFFFKWDPLKREVDESAFEGIEAIVNLSGANVGDKRWTTKYKALIEESRVLSTRLLVEKSLQPGSSVKTFICSSGIGYYGNDTGNDWVNETAPKGEGFLADVVEKWEQEALLAEEGGIRTVILRQGVVLSHSGGALPKLIKPIKLWAGAALGSGNQYFSWIDMDDMINLYLFCIRNTTMRGIFNAVAPHPVTNRELTDEMARYLNRKIWLPNVPAFVLRLLLGEFAETLLGGNRASSEKLEKTGFSFFFPSLKESLRNQL